MIGTQLIPRLKFIQCKTIIHNDRRMIGKLLVGVDAGAVHGVRDLVAGELVINAPTDVIFIRPSAIAPPSVLRRFWV